MKTYQVYIDVARDLEWSEIDVESITIDAHNANDAFMQANRIAQSTYEDFYVWEVTEQDLI